MAVPTAETRGILGLKILFVYPLCFSLLLRIFIPHLMEVVGTKPGALHRRVS